MKEKPTASPPKIFLKFFRWYCRPQVLNFIEGDLIEVHRRRLQTYGKRRADLSFIIDVMLLCRPGIIGLRNKNTQANNYGMFRSYFKIGFRNLWRSKLYSGINIAGLTFGIVCFLLIGLYVFDEATYDHQHQNADRIYRVIEHKNVKGEITKIAAASYKLSEESKHTIPEVENTTRVERTGRANLIDPEHPVNFQETITIADENFLKIFDFPLIAGDRNTALKEPGSIIINEDLAMRIFNRTDVLNKELKFSHLDFTMKITGILKNHPRNSSFDFNSVMSESSYHKFDYYKQNSSMDWSSNGYAIYALLRPESNPDSVSRKITALVHANYIPQQGTQVSYDLQPITDLHLSSANIIDGARNGNVDAMAQGNPLYLKIFTFAALFALLIAGINYTNLTTARASSRVKEIGVRKTIGAARGNLIWQFLIESLLVTSISLVLGILLVNLFLPMFNQFTGKQLSLGISTDYRFWFGAASLVVVIAILSGSYAALLLSHLKPASLLKGLKLQHGGHLVVRKSLVVFQFAISTIMIIGTILLILQVQFLSNSSLGFNKDLLVVIDVNTATARNSFEAIKNEMAKIPTVKNVSVTSRVPGEWKTFRTVQIKSEGSTEDLQVAYAIGADRDFIKTFGVEMLNGRNFDTPRDSLSIMINETAAKLLNITDAYDQIMEIPSIMTLDGSARKVDGQNGPFKPRLVGIVKDFHFQSLRDKIQPLVITYNVNPIHPIDYYSVKIASNDIQGTLAKLKAVMVNSDNDDPFEYHFLDQQLARFYIEDERRQTLLGWVALATIFIACLGLFGLATYSTDQRVKEIGVRKVLGASILNLTSLLSKDFIKLVLIANGIAFPVAWWGASLWLQEYAYHIDIEWWVFLAAGSSAVIIALSTVSYQAIKASLANPVSSLRSE